MKIGKINWD